MKGKTTVSACLGCPTVLTEGEEQYIVNYILHMASIGYPLTIDQVKAEVSVIIKEDGCLNPFTDDKPGEMTTRSYLLFMLLLYVHIHNFYFRYIVL